VTTCNQFLHNLAAGIPSSSIYDYVHDRLLLIKPI
jgi:hypothetical protein